MSEVLKRETVSLLSAVARNLHLYCSLQQFRGSKESEMGSHPQLWTDSKTLNQYQRGTKTRTKADGAMAKLSNVATGSILNVVS